MNKNRSWFDKKFRASPAIKPIVPTLSCLPALILIVIFSLSPAVLNLVLSFTDYRSASTPFEFIGFQNYIDFFSLIADEVAEVFLTTIKYTLLTIFPNNIIALLAAFLTTRNLKGQNFFRALYFMPMILGSVVVCFVWGIILDTGSGPMIKLLEKFGIETALLGDPQTSLYWVVLVTVWGNFGYTMILYIAGLQGIDGTQYEAAAIDGASGFKLFWYITMPLLKPTFVICFWIGISGSLGMADYILLTTNGNYNTETIGFYILRMVLYGSGTQGMNSAIIIYNFIFVTTVMLVFKRLTGGKKEDD